MTDSDRSRPTPLRESYWVLPGRILAGEYPGARNPDEASRRLETLLDAGVRLFVDLTEEGESGLKPYGTLLRDVADRRQIAVDHRRFPIRDVGTPTDRSQMIAILDTLEAALRDERIAYVHCWGGVGRTGLTTGCFLVRLGLEPQAALAQLSRLWAAVPKSRRKPGSPETPKQREFVRGWSEPERLTRRERSRGALLGLAAGDALGTTLEFRSPGSFEPIDDIVGGGPFRLKAGEWTDDTSMALCLATSLVERDRFDPADQMTRYQRWQDEGYLSSNGRCFDIGNTVRAALSRFAAGGSPVAGSTDRDTAGNGSLMRLAPVPLFYATDPAKAIRRAAESSLTTHGAPQAVDACAWMAAAIVGALEGREKSELLGPGTQTRAERALDRPLDSTIAAVAGGSFSRKSPPEIQGTGYVVASLEAALWALYTTDDFRDGALAAVNLGNDADTTGAVYGQLAGALYGERGIPESWRRRLAKQTEIEDLADRLFRKAHAID